MEFVGSLVRGLPRLCTCALPVFASTWLLSHLRRKRLGGPQTQHTIIPRTRKQYGDGSIIYENTDSFKNAGNGPKRRRLLEMKKSTIIISLIASACSGFAWLIFVWLDHIQHFGSTVTFQNAVEIVVFMRTHIQGEPCCLTAGVGFPLAFAYILIVGALIGRVCTKCFEGKVA